MSLIDNNTVEKKLKAQSDKTEKNRQNELLARTEAHDNSGTRYDFVLWLLKDNSSSK